MSETLLSTLLRQSLLLSLAIALLWAARRPLRRLGAGAVYSAWLLVPVLLLTPALPRPAQEPLRLVLQVRGESAVPALPPLSAPTHGAAAAWLALWLAGAAFVALVQARRQWRLARMGPRLPAGSSPALVGLLRPRVALPADFEQRFSSAERELILAHEQVHRERLDNLWNLLACALAALHWWNPLAWWAARRFQADQELACDAAVLASRPGALADYTRALLAAHDLHSLGAPLASRWGTTHPLVERIAMLNRSSRPSRLLAVASATALLGLVGLTYAAQQTPPATTAEAAAQQKVDIRMQITSGEFKGSPRLITALGVPTRIEWGPSPDQAWRLDLTVERADGGKLKVVTQTSYGGKPLGLHTGYIGSGEVFNHQVSGEGTPTLQMVRTVTLLPPDFKMPSQAAATAQ